MTRQQIEIESLAAFDEHVATTSSLRGWFIQSVDLTHRAEALRRVDPAGAIFLGCTLPDPLDHSLLDRGALIFPRLPDLPFNPYRAKLYDAVELYGEGGYSASFDAQVYTWSRSAGPARSLAQTLAASLHDHAITDALDEATVDLDPAHTVGVMGGHALSRTDPVYRDAARLAEELTLAGRTVLTGGGPGAMEAANLGAYLSSYSGALDEALLILSGAPGYRPNIDAWVGLALQIREKWPADQAGNSIGIPTWFYGHEPPNAFATKTAKYFTNALREDTLLHRCRGGIVYLPGAAGTVQEIFQAVTENYYAANEAQIAPLILVGEQYWTEELPAWPLLNALGRDRPMGAAIHCVPEISDAAKILLRE